MADRKQGAGLSSGSSTAVHKAHYRSSKNFYPQYRLIWNLWRKEKGALHCEWISWVSSA